jgi:hypothetical protein
MYTSIKNSYHIIEVQKLLSVNNTFDFPPIFQRVGMWFYCHTSKGSGEPKLSFLMMFNP